MKFLIRNDFKHWLDDDVFVVLFAIAVVTVLASTVFRGNVLVWVETIAQWLM
ncbi:hypothetical protein AB6E53_13130 [Vibrio breoganii]|uniref:hypothetical protein n=1 Tax=Vibrio breoganii TaxID=553239 RepID=UPI0012FFFCA4|nr:hypothetical protein [Vibrio breoganii]